MKIVVAAGSETVPALHVQGNRTKIVQDALVTEGALQIVVDGSPYSMTMRTPGEDAELALGLLFAEGVFTSIAEVSEVLESPAAQAAAPGGGADTVSLSILPSASAARGKPLAKRRLTSVSSCGICGLESAEDLAGAALCAGTAAGTLDITLIPTLEGRMRASQELFSRTGGCHAAAIFDLDGRLLVLKEDVGRHNAVDKAVGFLLRQGALEKAAVLFISGRVSYEIVTKAAKAGLRFLLAVSAPSTLAVTMCQEAGITLVGFCRGGKATVYSCPEAVRFPAGADAGEAP